MDAGGGGFGLFGAFVGFFWGLLGKGDLGGVGRYCLDSLFYRGVPEGTPGYDVGGYVDCA